MSGYVKHWRLVPRAQHLPDFNCANSWQVLVPYDSFIHWTQYTCSCIGPRLALVLLQYYLHHSSKSSWPTVVFVFGLVRTLSCGGWVYITSSDDHDVHDVCMIAYMVCNIPWMVGGISCTPIDKVSVRRKRSAHILSTGCINKLTETF